MVKSTTTSATNSAAGTIIRSSDVYIYGDGAVPVLDIDVSVFFAYSKRNPRTTNKE